MEANVASTGIAALFLNGSHISRTRHAHKVTASSLFILMNEAYSHFIVSLDQATHKQTFEECRREMEVAAPQFQYWPIILTCHSHLREISERRKCSAVREISFQLALCSMDHPKNARWLPVHLREMLSPMCHKCSSSCGWGVSKGKLCSPKDPSFIHVYPDWPGSWTKQQVCQGRCGSSWPYSE